MHFATNEVLRANFSVYASKKQGKLRKKIVRGMLMNYANVKVLYFDDDGTIPKSPSSSSFVV
jgi:ribosomal protein S6E (S10)